MFLIPKYKIPGIVFRWKIDDFTIRLKLFVNFFAIMKCHESCCEKNLYLSLCRIKFATVDAEKVASNAVTFIVDTTVTSCSEPCWTVKFHTI